jgi:hypothetical protein
MDRTREEIEDRKAIAKRLKKTNKQKWTSLTDQQREEVVERYFEVMDLKKLGPKALIEDAWVRAFAVDTTVFGVMLGVIGGAAATIIDRYLAPFGVIYSFFALLLFLLILIGVSHLPEMIKVHSLREGQLLEKLLEKEEG